MTASDLERTLSLTLFSALRQLWPLAAAGESSPSIPFRSKGVLTLIKMRLSGHGKRHTIRPSLLRRVAGNGPWIGLRRPVIEQHVLLGSLQRTSPMKGKEMMK